MHTTKNDSTNCTSRTIGSRLHDAQESSQCFQLHNAHKDVDVGKEAANKIDYCNPNHFDISYFRNLILVSH